MGRTLKHHINEYKFHKSITTQESENIARYFNDIKSYTPLSKQEELDLIILIQDNNDQSALSKLIKSNLKFVVTVAKRYQNQGVALMDLVQDGTLGLIEAASRFDRTRDLKFFSYAVWWIKIKIITNFDNHRRLIQLPANRSLLILKLKRKVQQLEDQLQRTPTVTELMKYFPDQSESDLHEAVAFTTLPLSLQSEVYQDNETHLSEVLKTDNYLEIDDIDRNSSLEHELNQLLYQLPQRSYDVLVLVSGLNGEEICKPDKIAYLFEIDMKEVAKLRAKAVKLMKKYKDQTNLNQYL